MRFTFGVLYRLEKEYGGLDKFMAVGPMEQTVRGVWAARLADEPALTLEDVAKELGDKSLPQVQELGEKMQKALADSGLAVEDAAKAPDDS